jgi:hypothetical protein
VETEAVVNTRMKGELPLIAEDLNLEALEFVAQDIAQLQVL